MLANESKGLVKIPYLGFLADDHLLSPVGKDGPAAQNDVQYEGEAGLQLLLIEADSSGHGLRQTAQHLPQELFHKALIRKERL